MDKPWTQVSTMVQLGGDFSLLISLDLPGMIHLTPKITKYFFSELKDSKIVFYAGISFLGKKLRKGFSLGSGMTLRNNETKDIIKVIKSC